MDEKEKKVSLEKNQGGPQEETAPGNEQEWEYDMYAPVPSLNCGYH